MHAKLQLILQSRTPILEIWSHPALVLQFTLALSDASIHAIGYFNLFCIYCFTAQVLKVCRTPGPTACSKIKMLHKVCLKS